MKCSKCNGDGERETPNGSGTTVRVLCQACMGTGATEDALRIVRNNNGHLCAIAEGGE